ncbi:M50 family metallopeptidase [Salinibacillus xinjiangensis]|uniref:Peptidase M50 domain-containing protein n=1 Tax=Salinibacillus xinjiangensis TaxID=1229268 RepID=A0A6G1X6F3_9BACI|nr:M50 family metallopeptidase [Salinibacillus xinjiangensis]MRG86460.1 hypothetical protein [Salinibacillus xinjiangensis]
MMNLVVFLFVIAPISIVLHELGHAGSAYLLKADCIHFSIGIGKERKVIRVGRLFIHLHTLPFMGGHAASEKELDFSKMEKILISSAGPLVNGLVAVLILSLFPLGTSNILSLTFYFNLWLAIMNIIPFRVGQKKSDGYVCMEIIFNTFRRKRK